MMGGYESTVDVFSCFWFRATQPGTRFGFWLKCGLIENIMSDNDQKNLIVTVEKVRRRLKAEG